MGRKRDDEDEPTPVQRAVQGACWLGGGGAAVMCVLATGKWLAGSLPSAAAKIGVVVLVVAAVWLLIRRHRQKG